MPAFKMTDWCLVRKQCRQCLSSSAWVLQTKSNFQQYFFSWDSHSCSDRRKSRSMHKLQFALWTHKFWSKTGNLLIWIILEVKVNHFWIFNKTNANQEIKFWVIKMKGSRGRKNIKQLGSFAVANGNSCGHRWVAVKTKKLIVAMIDR